MNIKHVFKQPGFAAVSLMILGSLVPMLAHSLEIKSRDTWEVIGDSVTISAGETIRWRFDPIPDGGDWP